MAIAMAALVMALAGAATAQDQGTPLPCGLGIAQVPAPLLQRAFLQVDGSSRVRVTFVGHSTFAIETKEGVMAATDFNGMDVPRRKPDIVTMNNSHSSHYTDYVDPGIAHVLRGWDPKGGIARHHLKLKDLRIYSLPTNIFDFGSGARNGNSVFVFEAAALCLAHLGHLHHYLSDEEIHRLGRIDVLFAPVDGSSTMSHEELFHVIGQIKPKLVIPMHLTFGGPHVFAARARALYPVKFHGANTIELGFDMLPRETEVLFLLEHQ
jgi:L-ascorbate metabolism protein UlaG (beta-lactamase superfamily)